MPYSVVSKKSGKTYILHSRNQQLKGGQQVMPVSYTHLTLPTIYSV